MAAYHRKIVATLIAFVSAASLQAQSPSPLPEGRVTIIFHDVQLLPEQAGARPAAIDDKVDENTALRTGDDSRSELAFSDLTITRLGANTIFSVNKAGRNIRLDAGSILVYARKNSGGAEISTKAVSVGITGTTLILESEPATRDRLTVLEGSTRFSLNAYPDQVTNVRGGQVLNVNAGARRLPKPGRVDLRRIVETHPLIKNFPPLPSLDLILGTQGRNLGGPRQMRPLGTGQPRPTYVPRPIPPPQPTPPPVGVPTPAPIATATPRPTPRPTARPTPRPTAKPTPRRPIFPPKPTPTPKKKYPPPKRTPTPTPVQIF